MAANAPASATAQEQNKAMTLKMLGVVAVGGLPIALAAAWWAWSVKELSYAAGSESHKVTIPANPPAKAKEQAPYCGDGVQKKYIGCN